LIFFLVWRHVTFRSPRWHRDVLYDPLQRSWACASYRLHSCRLRAFSVLGPRLWNSLPRLLRDIGHNTTSLGHSLKTFFSQSTTSAWSVLGSLAIMRYTNLRFTYLLTTMRLCTASDRAATERVRARRQHEQQRHRCVQHDQLVRVQQHR